MLRDMFRLTEEATKVKAVLRRRAGNDPVWYDQQNQHFKGRSNSNTPVEI